MARLRDRREELFCNEIVANPGGSIVDAYEKAGYARDEGNASRKYNLAHIQLRILEITNPVLDKYAATHEHIVDGFSKIAHADYREAFDDYGNVLPLAEMPEDVRYAIASLEIVRGKEGETITKIKFESRATALRELGKMGGSYNDLAKAGAGEIKVNITPDDAKL